MLLVEKNEERLQHIFDVATDEKYWTSDYFRLLNNEAASGKSIKTFEALAWLGVHTNYKVIYVQTFANKVSEKNDGIELQKTVGTINSFAKKNIANYLSVKNSKKHSQIIEDYNILCITHNKYYNLCKENRKNLIDKADILIIDEFPNLYEEYKIGRKELRTLHGLTLDNKKDDIGEVTEYLMELINLSQEQYGTTDIKIVNLHKQRNKSRVKILQKIKNKYNDKKIKEICDGCIELLSHGSVFYKNAFYTYNSQAQYKLAKKNNIILDANAGFDMRYKLRNELFKLDYQAKVFDYSNSVIVYYPIKTTKTKLNNYIDIVGDTIEYIKKNIEHNGCLIVADKDRTIKITDTQKEMYEAFNNIYFTHYGNFIGKNEWSKLDMVWSIKTPYYSFYQYVLMYMFFSGKELNGNTSCNIGNKKDERYVIFYNEEFDEFKNSIVAGEIYQAAKRIARDGRSCSINIVVDNPEIFELVKSQFYNIKTWENNDLEFREKKTKSKVKKEKKNDIKKKVLKKYKETGTNKILKKDFAKEVGFNSSNLSRELKTISKFLVDEGISIGEGEYREYIILNKDIA